MRMAEAYLEKPTEAAASFGNEQQPREVCEVKRLNPIVKALLQGIYDDNNDLSRLRGMWHILRHIWRFVITFYKENIKVTELLNPDETESDKKKDCTHGASYLNLRGFIPTPSYFTPSEGDGRSPGSLVRGRDWHQYRVVFGYNEIEFPKPTGININMMPFICVLVFKEIWQNCLAEISLLSGNEAFKLIHH